MRKIKVLIVDNDVSWIKEMTIFLSKCQDIMVVGTATNIDEAIKISNSVEPDIVIIDHIYDDTKLNDFSATADIVTFSKPKIIILTSFVDKDVIINSFSAGAVNCISKKDFSQLPCIIRNSLNDLTPLNVLAKEYLRMKKEEVLCHHLTPAEKQIIKLSKKGLNRSEIAEALNKSENTVKAQIKNILSKLNVSSLKRAVVKIYGKQSNMNQKLN